MAYAAVASLISLLAQACSSEARAAAPLAGPDTVGSLSLASTINASRCSCCADRGC
ncbi:hypothetical protein [Ramlibacter lithotrophicus]|uniref:hypothetical protein n=1 Tax=Ramlibacter lithotrophicus TaxID=2606681 RepID=UPI00143BD0B0|nr:hypothetical protein [Ramlibacter lithotrophicus]